MGRTPCCNAQGLKKGAWTPDEDQKLIAYINQHGQEGWRTLPHKAGLSRCGKSCRLRWFNYLSPAIKREEFTPDEDQIIIKLNATLGNRWSIIARHLPGRTDNDIKNYWNTHLKKRIIQKRIDQLKLRGSAPLASPSNVADTREPDSSSSSRRPISKSAQLLNKVATNVAPFQRLQTVRSIVGAASNNLTPAAGVDCIDDTDPGVLDNTDIVQKSRVSVSASAKLLNKTATRLGSPRLGISTLISILSSKPAEVGRRDCLNTVGSGSLSNPEFLDSLDLFDNCEVFSPYNVESSMSTLHLEWNIDTKTTAMPKCDSNELFVGTCDIENEAIVTWQQENPFDSQCGFSIPDMCI